MKIFLSKSKTFRGLLFCSLFFSGFSFLPITIHLLVNMGLLLGSLYKIYKIKWFQLPVFISYLWAFFFIFYFHFYKIPDLPDGWIGGINLESYLRNTTNVLCVYLTILLAKSSSNRVITLSFLPMGMLVFACLNTTFTLIKLEPPYYGKAYSFMTESIYNSPGTTILGSMYALYLISFSKEFIKVAKTYWIFLFLSIVLGLWISMIFTARTFFIVLFLGLCLTLLTKNRLHLDLKPRNVIFIFFAFSAVAVSIFFYNNDFFYRTLERLKSGDYSEKILHHKDYWNQIKVTFWQYPKSTFTYPWHYWFHSFLLDVHRTSGPFTMILATFLVFGTYFKSAWNFYRNTELGKESSIFLVLFFPYLFTTIPWESSESQMLVLFAGVSAIVFSDQRKEILPIK